MKSRSKPMPESQEPDDRRPEGTSGPSRPSRAPSTRQPTAITIRGSKEWRDWLDRGARHCLIDVAKLVDIATAKYLMEMGFDEPRPKR